MLKKLTLGAALEILPLGETLGISFSFLCAFLNYLFIQ